MSLGQSWAPPPPTGWRWTWELSGIALRPARHAGQGQARRRL